MRGMMPLFALALAAGCVQGENEIGPERPAPTPSSTLVPVSCPRIDLDVPDTLRQWGSAEMWANITNCSDVPAQLLSDEKCIFDRGVQVWLTRAGLSQSWLLFDGPAYETLGEGPWERMSCGDSPRAETTLAPGETWPHRFSWDASYQAGPCEPGCDARRLTPADLGDHVVQVDLMLPNGSHAMASANVTVLPALLPELPPSGDIRILLDNATLRAGEAVAVRVQNVGNGTYAYNPYYEACGWRYYDDQARPFRIPPGTHCDLMGEQPIAPGATVDAFHWSLDECVIDLWGCGSAAPLAPGVYHIRARFCIYDGAFSASDTCVPVGASFRIE